MSPLPSLDGVITADELERTAQHLASLQLDTGMIPWFVGGNCDPWNHVESAMALDVAGFHKEAEQAYEWLAAHPTPGRQLARLLLHCDGSVDDSKLDTNVCAYIATGVWHHWRSTWDRGFADNMWPTVERALEFVLSLRRDDGVALWAIEPDDRPWDYALLTGTSSIQHALRCGARLADALNDPQPRLVDGRRRDDRGGQDPPGCIRAEDGDGRWTGTTPCSPVRSWATRPKRGWPTAGTRS